MNDNKGQLTLLILGGSSDVARSVAKLYAENQYNIILSGRNIEDMTKTSKDLEVRYSVETEVLYFDALDYNSHYDFYSSLSSKPDVILCLVGYLGFQEKAALDFNHCNNIISSNYTGVVSILNVVANDFEKNNQGVIIALSSVAGDRGRESNYIYGSAKAGLTCYLSGLRNRLFKSNVQVITVKPGFIDTSMTQGMELPALLTAQPDQVAKDIFNAQEKGRNNIYTLWFWRWIMSIICVIPEPIFKRLKI